MLKIVFGDVKNFNFSEADEFEAYIENTGKSVHNNNEYVSEAYLIEEK